MSESKNDVTYSRRLTECATLADLRDLLDLYADLAVDARRIVTAMTAADFVEFRRGLRQQRKGRFAGIEWAKKFAAVMMPEPMLTISSVANEYGAPFSVAWLRIREIRPELLTEAATAADAVAKGSPYCESTPREKEHS